VLVWRWIATHQAQLLARRDALLSYPPLAWFRVRYARELQWVRQRLTPGAFLGLHVTLGLLVAAGFLWLFGGVLQDVLAHDPLIRFDDILARMLQSWATPSATILFVLISDLGAPLLFVLSIIVAVFYSLRRQWLYLGGWLVALGGGEFLNLLTKQLVARPRPVFSQPELPANDYSFPSSHALLSLIAYGLLAYFVVLGLRTWRARTAVICAATMPVLLIGFSRLYLGMEYLSDVAGGYAGGGVWLSTCITGMELIRRGEITGGWIRRLQRWNGQHDLS